MLQEDGSGAASPPRDVAEQDHDSVYDAETEPSAGEDEVEAQMDLEDTYQTQRRRPAGIFNHAHPLALGAPISVIITNSEEDHSSEDHCTGTSAAVESP